MEGNVVTDSAAPPPGVEGQLAPNGHAGMKRDYHGGFVQHRDGPGGGQEGIVKLFVGSVPRTIREEEVRPMFEEFGKVVEVALIKDKVTGVQRGCCFVKYGTLEEAERAIRGLNNQRTLPGSSAPVQVRFADGERERLGIGAQTEFKLFVGSLSKSANEKEIEGIFSKYGQVDDVYIMRDAEKNSRGCAFVKFSTREGAQAAIDGLNGVYTMPGMEQPVAVRFADPKRPRPGDARVGGPGAGFQGGQFSPNRGSRGGGGPGGVRPGLAAGGWRPMGGPGLLPGAPGGSMPMSGPGLLGPRAPYPVPGAAPMMGAPMAGPPMQMAPVAAAPGQMAPGMGHPQQPIYYQQPPLQQPQPPSQQMYAAPQQQPMPTQQTQMVAPPQAYFQPAQLQQAVPQQQPQPQQNVQQQPQQMQTMWQQPQYQAVPGGQPAVAAPAPVQVPAAPPAPAPVPPTCDWTEHTSPEGHKYYYNGVTQESRWEKPAELTAFEAAQQQQQLQQQQQQQQQQQAQSQVSAGQPVYQPQQHLLQPVSQPQLQQQQQPLQQGQPQVAAMTSYPQYAGVQASVAQQAQMQQPMGYPQQAQAGAMQHSAPQQQQPQQVLQSTGAPTWTWAGMPTGTGTYGS